ncbi:MAG: NAD(P)-dependent dehydrogenase (short-subunit alcohol dehydrogenase family) [Planctomycetota bacterium]|jgi:NAD(P)-dependent dehydrogenase (short-subunit alcohol dehydrogenase family)
MAPIRIFVTGGSRGIGRAIALRFAREGAQVCVAARTSADLDAVVLEIVAAGGEGIAAQANLRDHGSIEAAVYRAVDFFDEEMDILVNNAGIFDSKSIEDCDLAMWERFLEVNLTGPFIVTQESLNALKESPKAHIFNISSEAGRKGFPGSSIYSATKYGLRGFSDGLREDLREAGIRVSTVYPGSTNTGIHDGVAGDWDTSKMNKPEDVAEVIWQAYHAEGEQADLDVPPPT